MNDQYCSRLYIAYKIRKDGTYQSVVDFYGGASLASLPTRIWRCRHKHSNLDGAVECARTRRRQISVIRMPDLTFKAILADSRGWTASE